MFIIIGIIIALGILGYVMMRGQAVVAPKTSETATITPLSQDTGASGIGTTVNSVKEIAVSGSEFAFSPNTINVNKGDTVKVTFTNTGKFPHNFTISELNVASKTISPGQSDTVTFVADKAGTFTYFCSVPTHKDKGMVGTLTVQ